jgi:hypothetical protein
VHAPNQFEFVTHVGGFSQHESQVSQFGKLLLLVLGQDTDVHQLLEGVAQPPVPQDDVYEVPRL